MKENKIKNPTPGFIYTIPPRGCLRKRDLTNNPLGSCICKSIRIYIMKERSIKGIMNLEPKPLFGKCTEF